MPIRIGNWHYAKCGFGKWSTVDQQREFVKIAINKDIIKLVGNFEGVIETSRYAVIDRDGQFDFMFITSNN